METGRTPPQRRDFFGFTRGFSGTGIKIIGLVMMVVDHLYQMFHVRGAPVWFHWIGRPVAPLFLFICAEGFFYTRSRKWYILRFLMGYEVMTILSTALSFALPNEDAALIFSIFGSLFFAALYMRLIDLFREGIKQPRSGKPVLAVLLMLLPLAYGIASLRVLSSQDVVPPRWAVFVLFKLVPNIMAVEGGPVWVLLGALFYALRKNRILQVLPLVFFGALFFMLGDIQWLLVFAALPILFYNGTRGRGGKYFFYIFYPAHIYLLYIAAYFLRNYR